MEAEARSLPANLRWELVSAENGTGVQSVGAVRRVSSVMHLEQTSCARSFLIRSETAGYAAPTVQPGFA
jgi:hypothetical protein